LVNIVATVSNNTHR